MAGTEYNIDEVQLALAEIEREIIPFLHDVARYADARVGKTATTKYMRDAGKEAGLASRSVPMERNRTGTLRILTGRLRRSVSGGFTALEAGRVREGFVKVEIRPGPEMVFTKGSTVPYARIQEEGGTVTIPITAKSRRFFWAMFIRTGQGFWKGLALTKRTSIKITIPSRPYLGPALIDEAPAIQKYGEQRFERMVRTVLTRRLK